MPEEKKKPASLELSGEFEAGRVDPANGGVRIVLVSVNPVRVDRDGMLDESAYPSRGVIELYLSKDEAKTIKPKQRFKLTLDEVEAAE